MTNPASSRIGVWLVGLRGSIGAAAAASLPLLRGGAATTGMVTALQEFTGLGLANWDRLTLGGCDVSSVPLRESLERHVAEGILPPSCREQVGPFLDGLEREVDDLSHLAAEPRGDRLVAVLRSAVRRFRERNRLDRVVVVNLSSTRPVSATDERLAALTGWEALEEGLRRPGETPPWSIAHAAAALLEGCAYINFTPNLGTEIPGLAELAKERRLPHAGKDGKTGETLVKSVLAPLFQERGLRVLTWQGYNLLGNNDGRSLVDPGARATKVRSKHSPLRSILRDSPQLHAHVGIDYVPSLGDWKTAWDFIHFEGFLGVRMNMQFTWCGCDTALAVPLIYDLVRLVELAWRRGEDRALGYLASFFKSPLGCDDHDFRRQIDLLYDHLGLRRSAPGTRTSAAAVPSPVTEREVV